MDALKKLDVKNPANKRGKANSHREQRQKRGNLFAAREFAV
jgi:hypothetical protein